MKAPSELVVLLEGRVAGRVAQDGRGHLRFIYEETWRESHRPYALSMSMPLGRRAHEDAIVRPWLEGLLPDDDALLRRWGTRFGVSARNPFALLAHVGEDCAGAVQFVPPERAAMLLEVADPPVEWLTERDVAERLRELRHPGGATRDARDPGHFSLAGAQPKTAFLLEDGRWGVPSGRVPTTHILKPPSGDFDGFAENEHVCLRTARALGLPAARTEVRYFENEVAIVVERYDRVRTSSGWIRVHQEDFCQALSVSPRTKYESEGGPGVAAVAGVLRTYSRAATEDLSTFVGALALNWAMGGTDGHAKNFSLLIAAQQVRLAPLYDVISVLPYPKLVDPRRARLAMRIGREYALWKIGRMHWERLGEEVGMGAEAAVERVRWIVTQIPDAVSAAVAGARGEGIEHPILDTLQAAITEHAASCLRRLDSTKHSDDAAD